VNRPDPTHEKKTESDPTPRGAEWLALGAEALRYGGALGLRPDAVFSLMSHKPADPPEEERVERRD
jgi:hypothetical protein